jgi:micrococcal nuclease
MSLPGGSMMFSLYRAVLVGFLRGIIQNKASSGIRDCRLPRTGRRPFIFGIVFLLPFIVTSYSYGWYGKAVVVDNNCKITVERPEGLTRVTLYGIRCPQSGQPFGNKALHLTGWLVLGKQVEVIPVGIDSVAETTGLVRVQGSPDYLNSQLIAYGMAWLKNRNPVIPLCDQWRKLEELARIHRIGLWAGNTPALPKGRHLGKITNHDRHS